MFTWAIKKIFWLPQADVIGIIVVAKNFKSDNAGVVEMAKSLSKMLCDKKEGFEKSPSPVSHVLLFYALYITLAN